MNDQRFVLREIAWREIFPWLLLFRTMRIALQPSALVVALLAVFLLPWVQTLGRWIFRVDPPFGASGGTLGLPLFLENSPLSTVFHQFTAPVLAMYRTDITLAQFAYCLFVMLGTLAISAMAGGMISRIAVVRLGREEQTSLGSAFQVARSRWFDYFTAPLYPILGTVVIALLSMPVGWMLLANVGTIAAGVLWPLVLIGGFISALMLLWLFVGWPLMWPAISAEETGDAFEAMSRSCAYAFQRPLHYLGYAFIALVFGAVGLTVVAFVCQQAVESAWWAVSWGCGRERTALLQGHLEAANLKDLAPSLRIGLGMVSGLNTMLYAVQSAFAFSYFWVAASAIYLLLRQDVDHTEFDEVWSDEDAPRYPLPAVVPNEDGVPMVQPASVQKPAEPVVESQSANPPAEQEQAE